MNDEIHDSVYRTLRQNYDKMYFDFRGSGVDVDGFYNNQDYFGTTKAGRRQPWRTSYPSLVHWPLDHYPGGRSLLARLQEERKHLRKLISPHCASWISMKNWHSTVFSPSKSSNPMDVSMVNEDHAAQILNEVRVCGVYNLRFTRIVITHRCGILAMGYASNNELHSLRQRLLCRLPLGFAPSIIHVTLGVIVRRLAPECIRSLQAYCASFLDERICLGSIEINSLAYAIYKGPITKGTLTSLQRQPFDVSAKGEI